MYSDARNVFSGLLATLGGFLLPVWGWIALLGGSRVTPHAIVVIAVLLLAAAFSLQWTDPDERSWHVPILFGLVGAALFPLVLFLFFTFAEGGS